MRNSGNWLGSHAVNLSTILLYERSMSPSFRGAKEYSLELAIIGGFHSHARINSIRVFFQLSLYLQSIRNIFKIV